MGCRIYRFFYLVANKKLFSDFSCSAKMKEIGNKVESWFVAAVAFLQKDSEKKGEKKSDNSRKKTEQKKENPQKSGKGEMSEKKSEVNEKKSGRRVR